jgi:hypothetical protein
MSLLTLLPPKIGLRKMLVSLVRAPRVFYGFSFPLPPVRGGANFKRYAPLSSQLAT